MSSRISPGFLVAAPQLKDPNFARTVVLMMEHEDDEGSLGLVINRSADLGLADVLEAMEIEVEGEVDGRSHPPVMYGGPVAVELGWILHSADWDGEQTRPVADGVRVTASRDIVEAIATGRGPASYMFCLGYAGWGPGQLIGEIKSGSWITVPFEADLVFDVPMEDRWEAALRRLGIDPGALAATVGDA